MCSRRRNEILSPTVGATIGRPFDLCANSFDTDVQCTPLPILLGENHKSRYGSPYEKADGTKASFQRVILSEAELFVSERSEAIKKHAFMRGIYDRLLLTFRYKVTFDKEKSLCCAIEDPALRRLPMGRFDYENVTL